MLLNGQSDRQTDRLGKKNPRCTCMRRVEKQETHLHHVDVQDRVEFRVDSCS